MRLKELREQAGLTQEEAGRIIGVPRTTWRSYETERTQMPYEKLFEVADYFCAEIEYILGYNRDSRISKAQ